MTDQATFQPNWTSRPGATILRLMSEQKISAKALAREVNINEPELRDLLSGRIAIRSAIASKLAAVLGGTEAFWLAREEQYRNDVSQREVRDLTQLGGDWLRNLPVNDMQKFGWIDGQVNRSSLVQECLRFFDIGQIEIWHRSYATMMENTAFRKSERFASNVGACTAWFRQAELEAEAITCAQWDPEQLSHALPRLRSLTWTKNPAIFVPKLQDVCADCGVAFTMVPLPEGCTASGATWFSSSTKATLVMSGRYLSDDHFWFTFFHEAGHLLLHKTFGPIIEDPDISSESMEEDANSFASEILIPREFREELFALNTSAKRIFEFSKRIGVAPGIVVGQLQHFGRLARNKLNYLKRRYVWTVSNGSANLEMV